MGDFVLYILTAVALVFVLEGLLYSLFPDAMKRMMAYAMGLASEQLRTFGIFMVCIGLGVVWLLQMA